jgi:uncharacterized membrane protein
MVHSQRDIEIGKPIDVVFDFLADGANNPRWQSRVVKTTHIGQHQGTDSNYRQSVRHPLGFTVSANYRLTGFDRPRWLQFKVTSGGPIRPTGAYELTSISPTRTRVRFTIEYKPRRAIVLAIPFLPFVRVLFDRETLWIDRAKRVLEARGGAAAPAICEPGLRPYGRSSAAAASKHPGDFQRPAETKGSP